VSHDPTDTLDCGRVALSLQAYLRDDLPAEKRRLVRRHIHECPSCFAKAVASDPAEIFAPLAEGHSLAKPDPFWDGFWPAIQEGIAREGVRGRFRPPARWAPITRRAAALVALAAAAAAIVFVMVGAPWRARVPAAMPAVGSSAPVDEVATASGSGQHAIFHEGRPLPPTVELMRTPDPANARIFSMTYYEEPAPGAPAGASPRATELVLIVDAGIEL
jgi:anti-sigma factor RsiW